MRKLYTLVFASLVLFSACSRSPSKPKVLTEADQAFVQGRYFESEKLYYEFIRSYEESPYRWEAWNQLLAISRHVRQDFNRTREILETMKLEFGDDPAREFQILLELAREYARVNDFDRAVATYERLMDRFPALDMDDKWVVIWELSHVLKDSGNYAQARELLIKSLDLSVGSEKRARMLYEVAQLYLFQENMEQAMHFLQRVLDMAEPDEEITILATFTLGDLYQRQGNLKKAKELFLSIKDTYPNPVTVSNRLQYLEKQLQEKEEQ